MRSSSNHSSRRLLVMLGAFVFALVAAGCHRNNLTSGYGLMLTTLTTQRSQFSSYLVTVDNVTLTGAKVGTVTAVQVPEIVDFNRLTDIAELWANASLPNDTYSSAAITLDFSNANISMLINGVPTKLAVTDQQTGTTATTITVTVNLDPTNKVVSVPTYATTSAVRMAISLDMSLSNTVNVTGAAPAVTVHPFFTMATSAPDQKMIAVRGPLINSSVGEKSYSVYVRPFYDEVNTAGTLSLYSDDNTIFTIDGTSYIGAAGGITRFSQSSTGTTMTRALTTYEPTLTPSATAAIFHVQQVIAGSTLENFQTGGLEGEIIARSGNTLTMRASTLGATTLATAYFNELDATITVGPNTIVTQDGTANQTGLDYNSIAVGQHIIARGVYTIGDFTTVGVVMDATSASQPSIGSVRLVPTEAYGTVVSAAAGSSVLNLQYLNRFPVSIYNFAGNGTTDPTNYQAATGTLALPTDVAVGGPLFVDGIVAPFGTAPPNLNATAINSESTVPADMIVTWSAGTTVPFSTSDATGFVIDLSNASIASATINAGAEAINLIGGTSPLVAPAVGTPAGAGLPSVFLPLFGLGTPSGAVVSVYNTLATFQAAITAGYTAATPLPVSAFAAHGYYDRANNLFTASSINVVN